MPWVQYLLSDGTYTGSVSVRVDDDVLAAVGKGQIQFNSTASVGSVDVTQEPPVVIPEND